jgi:hypothetical protein
MSQPDLSLTFDDDLNPVQEEAKTDRKLSEPSPKRAS